MRSEVALFLFLTLLISSLCVRFLPEVHGKLQFENEKMMVYIYAVALDDVTTVGIGNATKALEGVEYAIEHLLTRNFTVDFTSSDPKYNYYSNVSRFVGHPHQHGLVATHLDTDFQANITLRVVKDWAAYKSIVENGQECIIVNIHGAVLPIPKGMSKEAWTDKIAEAMLFRNVTWVHVAGHPFYYSWTQGENSKQQWGDAGFQRLMQHIGKENITIRNDKLRDVWLTGEAESCLRDTWQAIYLANQVSPNYALAAKSLEGYEALSIWSTYWSTQCTNSDFYAGVVVSFKSQLNATSHGFYVHIGTNQTLGPDGELNNPDFWRCYMGSACGLWSLVSRTARETLIGEAEALIKKATNEGRTSGLDGARSLLETAKEMDRHYADEECFMNAYNALLAATLAEKPKTDLPAALLTGLGVGITVAVVVGAIVWRRQKNDDEEET